MTIALCWWVLIDCFQILLFSSSVSDRQKNLWSICVCLGSKSPPISFQHRQHNDVGVVVDDDDDDDIDDDNDVNDDDDDDNDDDEKTWSRNRWEDKSVWLSSFLPAWKHLVLGEHFCLTFLSI